VQQKTNITKQIEDSIELKKYLQKEVKNLIAIANLLVAAFRKGNKVLLFGNGGSAADAQHIACELAGKLYLDREPLPAVALTTNTSALTAIGNDYSYKEIFARQVKALVKRGDVVVGLSTSGNSPNVLQGIEEAKRLGAVTVALTGRGGRLKKSADYVISVPSVDTPRIQEAHITAGHIICYLIEQALFGQKRKKDIKAVKPIAYEEPGSFL
jgi:D-sedoheptulose 7-phosphate isomerase